MAQTFCTGPVHVGYGTGGVFSGSTLGAPTATFYFGTTRTGPDIEESKSYFNVMNDLAGPEIPLDRGYAGSEHTVVLEMTRWDGATDRFMDIPISGSVQGTEFQDARGTLVSRATREQLLLLNSEFNTGVPTPDFTSVRWRRYGQVVNIGPNKPIWGNKENAKVRIYKCQNCFLGVTINNLASPGFFLYDEGFGTPPFVPNIT